MSLMMAALRIAAVNAVKSAGTLVGSNVLDSKIAPIDVGDGGQLSTSQDHPFVAVYTDKAASDDLGSVGLRANGRIELTFNCGVALSMWQTNKETGVSTLDAGDGEWVQGFPATDENFEFTIDVICAQIIRALGDPDNAWGQVFSGLCQVVSKSQVRSGSAVEQVRLACGQLKLTVQAHADPAFGQPLAPDGFWSDFLALMQRDALPQLPFFQMLLGDPSVDGSPDVTALAGLTISDAQMLKLYGLDGAPVAVEIASVSSEPVVS